MHLEMSSEKCLLFCSDLNVITVAEWHQIWRHRSGLTLAQVMAWCFTVPSHYLNQCWLSISKVQWHSSEGNSQLYQRYLDHWLLKLAWKITWIIWQETTTAGTAKKRIKVNTIFMWPIHPNLEILLFLRGQSVISTPDLLDPSEECYM